MTHINLLPWREKKREQEKKLFASMFFFGVVVALLIVFVVDYYVGTMIEHQEYRNSVIQKEIISFDGQIAEIRKLREVRDGLISRMNIIQNLQSTRTLTVHLFDELVKIMPDGVYVTKIQRNNDQVDIFGYTESNTNISDLMRNIENNRWIQNPTLTEIKKTNKDRNQVDNGNNEFKLSFILRPKDMLELMINGTN